MEGTPVVCTLQPRQFADRRQAWRQLLEGWLIRREATPGGACLILQSAPGVGRTARELAELEAECCRWLSIRIEEGDVVTLHLHSTEAEGPSTIRQMFAIPDSIGA